MQEVALPFTKGVRFWHACIGGTAENKRSADGKVNNRFTDLWQHQIHLFLKLMFLIMKCK
jgi:hypothetical protein